MAFSPRRATSGDPDPLHFGFKLLFLVVNKQISLVHMGHLESQPLHTLFLLASNYPTFSHCLSLETGPQRRRHQEQYQKKVNNLRKNCNFLAWNTQQDGACHQGATQRQVRKLFRQSTTIKCLKMFCFCVCVQAAPGADAAAVRRPHPRPDSGTRQGRVPPLRQETGE